MRFSVAEPLPSPPSMAAGVVSVHGCVRMFLRLQARPLHAADPSWGRILLEVVNERAIESVTVS